MLICFVLLRITVIVVEYSIVYNYLLTLDLIWGLL